jgi:ATP-dependent Clp protease ATP-binding subunit ClpA
VRKWDIFTERARRAVAAAHEEAKRLGHDRFGTHHLLLGIIAESTSDAASVPALRDVDLIAARDAVERLAPRKQASQPQDVPFSHRARHAIELAFGEARRLKHDLIGTEHLLLGIIGQPESTGARALAALGIDIDQVQIDLRTPSVQPQSLKQHAPTEGFSGWSAFTESARRAVELAGQRATALGQRRLGSEHLLAGIVADGTTKAAAALVAAGASLERISRELPHSTHEERPDDHTLAFSDHVKKAIERAYEEAVRVRMKTIGCEQLLIGIIGDPADPGAKVLESAGVNLAELRRSLTSEGN